VLSPATLPIPHNTVKPGEEGGFSVEFVNIAKRLDEGVLEDVIGIFMDN